MNMHLIKVFLILICLMMVSSFKITENDEIKSLQIQSMPQTIESEFPDFSQFDSKIEESVNNEAIDKIGSQNLNLLRKIKRVLSETESQVNHKEQNKNKENDQNENDQSNENCTNNQNKETNETAHNNEQTQETNENNGNIVIDPNPQNPQNKDPESHCQTMVSSSPGNLRCVQCKLGQKGEPKYLLIDGVCYKPDNSTDKEGEGNETKWQNHDHLNREGHVSYGGRPFKCAPGCKVCNSSVDLSQCSTCIDGFYLNASSLTCLKCNESCVTCDSSNPDNCSTCYPGLTLKETPLSKVFTCVKCSDAHCGNCTTQQNCATCKNFYYLAEDKTCKSCLSNCRNCTNSTSCLECLDGYFLNKVSDSVSECVLCTEGCASCSSSLACNKCYPGFFLNSSTAKCQKCSENCWGCSSVTNCSRCIIGTYLLNATCVTSIQSCANMSTNGTCSQCFWGYTLSQSKDQCVGNGSTSMQINGRSMGCMKGKFLKDFKCSDCNGTIQNCRDCNSSVCLKCNEGFYVTSKGACCSNCTVSLSGCQDCQNPQYCERCLPGFYMEQDIVNGSLVISYGNCLKCSDNCKTCHERDSYCTSCGSGYGLTTSRTCVPQNQFNFTVLLNLNLTDFPSKMEQFKSGLASLIRDDSVSTSEKLKYIQIRKVTSGSVKVEGTVSASSASALQSTLQNYQQTFSVGSSFSGVEVLSSDMSPPKYSEGSSDSSSNSKVGLIVGVVVGVVAAVIIASVVIYCLCVKKQSQAHENNPDEKRSRSTASQFDDFAAIRSGQNLNNENLNKNIENPKYFV